MSKNISPQLKSKTLNLKPAVDNKNNVSLINNNYYVIIRNKIYEEFGEKEQLKETFFYGKLQTKENKIKFLNPVNIEYDNSKLLDLTEIMEKKRYKNDIIDYKMTELQKINTKNEFESINEKKMNELFNGDIILNNELCFFDHNKLTDFDFYIIEEDKKPKEIVKNPDILIEDADLDKKQFADNARFLESIKAKSKAVDDNIKKTMAETNKLEKIVNKNVELRELTKNRIELLEGENRKADIKAHAALLKQEQIQQNIEKLNEKKKTIQGLVSIIVTERDKNNNTFTKRLANANKLPSIKKTIRNKDIDNIDVTNMANQLFKEDIYKKKGGKRKTKKYRKHSSK